MYGGILFCQTAVRQPIVFDGFTYTIINSTSGKTWRDAQNDCRQKGGDLASLNYAMEHDHVASFLPDPKATTCSNSETR